MTIEERREGNAIEDDAQHGTYSMLKSDRRQAKQPFKFRDDKRTKPISITTVAAAGTRSLYRLVQAS